MIGKYDRNNAEEIFYINLNKHIKVELITGEIFEGKLLGIYHNILIIRNDEDTNEIFRHEDIRFLQCRENLISNKDKTDDNVDKDIYAKDIDGCETCPLYQKDCGGVWTSNGNGTPIEPPCVSWDDDDLIWEGMYCN